MPALLVRMYWSSSVEISWVVFSPVTEVLLIRKGAKVKMSYVAHPRLVNAVLVFAKEFAQNRFQWNLLISVPALNASSKDETGDRLSKFVSPSDHWRETLHCAVQPILVGLPAVPNTLRTQRLASSGYALGFWRFSLGQKRLFRNSSPKRGSRISRKITVRRGM